MHKKIVKKGKKLYNACMESGVTEVSYPLTFREEDAKRLGEHLRHRHCVNLVGMKRVGISNFLRFFLYHKDVATTFISRDEKHVLISVDLNDLVERELYPFWTLTFKRLVDFSEHSSLSEATKQKIGNNFLSSIQSQDLFLLIDGIRRSLTLLVGEGFIPTIFFIRFDRIKESVTPEFFANLQGLRDSLHMKLSYVFTSYRTLDEISPNVFSKASLSVFSHVMYIKPSTASDLDIISVAYRKRYSITLSDSLTKQLFSLVSGYVQYLQLALILLNERKDESSLTKEQLTEILTHDERITLQSEELWESLTDEEKLLLLKVNNNTTLSENELKAGAYLKEVGIIIVDGGTHRIFSELFAHFINQHVSRSEQQKKEFAFSKKENLMFTFLKTKLGEICEREELIEEVWPEYQEFGVSDWSIDRLIARVRSKLKEQGSQYEIKTVRTRGYVLISKV